MLENVLNRRNGNEYFLERVLKIKYIKAVRSLKQILSFCMLLYYDSDVDNCKDQSR